MNSTILGKGVPFSIDQASGVPFYRQVIRRIEDAAAAGLLEPGDRLPTIRSLSVELKINPNTIAKAYAELELRGIVKTQVGSGTYVAARPAGADRGAIEAREALIDEKVAAFVREMRMLGVDAAGAAERVLECREES